MATVIAALDKQGGQALVHSDRRWYRLAIDNSWKPVELRDELDAALCALAGRYFGETTVVASLDEAARRIRLAFHEGVRQTPDTPFALIAHHCPRHLLLKHRLGLPAVAVASRGQSSSSRDHEALSFSALFKERLLEFVRDCNALIEEINVDVGPFISAAPLLANFAKKMEGDISYLLLLAQHFNRPPANQGFIDVLRDLSNGLTEFTSRLARLMDVAKFKPGAGAGPVSTRLKHDGRVVIERVTGLLQKLADMSINEQNQTAPQTQASTVQPLVSPQTAQKVIVGIDVAHYSDMLRLLDEALTVPGVNHLNWLIERMIREAMLAAHIDPETIVAINIGDGAFLAFDDADQAHSFVKELFRLADERNRVRSQNVESHFYFRVGVSSGEIILRPLLTANGELKGYTMAGRAIAEAKGLESAAETGQVLMHIDTWNRLTNDTHKKAYEMEQLIRGKRGETINAKRATIGKPDPRSA